MSTKKAIQQIKKMNLKGVSVREAKSKSFTAKQKAAIKKAREQLK